MLTLCRPSFHMGLQEDGGQRQVVGVEGLDGWQGAEEECEGGLILMVSWEVLLVILAMDTIERCLSDILGLGS